MDAVSTLAQVRGHTALLLLQQLWTSRAPPIHYATPRRQATDEAEISAVLIRWWEVLNITKNITADIICIFCKHFVPKRAKPRTHGALRTKARKETRALTPLPTTVTKTTSLKENTTHMGLNTRNAQTLI